jgi:hypothetical protein
MPAPQPAPNESWTGARKLVVLVSKGFRHLSSLQWGLIGAAPVLLVSALLITYSHRPRKPVLPPVASEYFVDLESNVANAKYRVDTRPAPASPLRLPPGDHTVEAFLPGYKPATRSFTLSPGVAKPYVVSFQLEPELVRLRLSSGLKSGQVSLDGQPPVDLQDGNFVNDAIALSNEHTFSLTQVGKESLLISFRAEPGGMVTLSTPIKVKDVSVVVIATLDSSARVYSSDNSLKAGLKDSTPQPIPPGGLEFGGITANTEITLDDGKAQRTLPMEVGNAPTLTISLANDPNLGTLEVEVSVPGAELALDARRHSFSPGRTIALGTRDEPSVSRKRDTRRPGDKWN